MLRLPTGYKADNHSACEDNQDAREAMARSSTGLTWAIPTGEHLLVLVEPSRWLEVDIIKSTTSETIIKCLDKQFSRYGVPSTLRTDNGPNLVSAEMEEYLNEMGI